MAMQKLLLAFMLVALSVTLGACGRVSKPVAPETVDQKYPRQYPAPQPVPELKKQ